MNLKKIVIIGPESTGKSYTTKFLANHFNGIFAHEYAREYLTVNGIEYGFDNLYPIAEGQIRNEEEGIKKAKEEKKNLLFLDTDLYVIKVWSEFVFGKCDNRILSQIAERKYDLYLLCATDLPWVKDEMREYPDLETRELLFRHYKDIMVQQSVPFKIISGTYEERIQVAIEAVKTII